ncbi:MAG TPA: hypothetical protein VF520_05315 [Thermoleophilaceae bacterium]
MAVRWLLLPALVLVVALAAAADAGQGSGPFQSYPHWGPIAQVGAKSGKVKLSAATASRPLANGRALASLPSAKRHRSSKGRVHARAAAADPLFGSASLAKSASPTSANSRPTANDRSVTVKQNSPKNITLTGSDPDGDPITFRIVKQPNHGTLSGQPPNVTYTPDPNRLGPDHFFFVTNDGQVDSKAGKVSIRVVPRGVPSTVTASPGCTAYGEQAPAVAVDGQLTVSDPDDTTLDSARVRIAANFENGDELLFTDQNGISGSYDGSTGVLTLSGTASVADYQAALRSVRFRNLSSDDPSATKDVEFTVNDAGGDSAPATKQICVAAVNDPPALDTTDTALSYTEGDGAVAVDSGIAASDPDSAQLQGATVQVTSNFVQADDELAFANTAAITGVYDDATGTLTLSGTASVADYQAALRSVTYENGSDNPSGTKTVSFQATDTGGATSSVATRDIALSGTDDAPVVSTSPGSTSYRQGGLAAQVDGSLTVADVDDTNLEGGRVRISAGFQSGDDLVFVNQNGISGVYDTGTGVLTLTGTASVADYQEALRSIAFQTTAADPSTPKTVEFVVGDGELDSAPATKDVEVTAGNQAPTLETTESALPYTTGDGPEAVDDEIRVSDPDSALSGATIRISSNFIAAEDGLAFTAQDGIAGSYDDATGTLTLTGTASVADYQSALRSVTYENSSANPSTATRTISFQVVDSESAASNVATRDVEINQTNEAPVVTTSPGPTAYSEGGPSTAVDSALTVSDANDANLESATVRISSGFEEGDLLTVEDRGRINSVYNPESGVLTMAGRASVADYQATLRSVGYFSTGNPSQASKTVEFRVSDGTADSDAATKAITVVPPPPPPPNLAPAVTTSDGPTAYAEGDPPTTVDSAVTVSDLDDANIESATVRISSGYEDGDALTFEDQAGIFGIYNAETGVLALSGSASVADYQAALRSVGYFSTGNPSAEFKTVAFQVNDGDADSNTATKTIAVTARNDQAPVVTTSEGSTSYRLGDETGVVVDDALTVTDADDANLEGGRVQIEGFEPGDELVYVDQPGISGSFDPGVGVLDLAGTASVADYEAALRSIRFRHSGDNQSAFRSVAFRVNDGDLDSSFALKRIDVVTP